MPDASLELLLRHAKEGDWLALGRLLTATLNDPIRVARRAREGEDSSAMVVGLTGPPGVGKSCLTSALTAHARARDRQVAVLCVDPSSPYTGGAVLGDRIRMHAHNLDRGVFVRSFASRGQLGGLAAAIPSAIAVFSTCGFDLILVETVGVGQSETAVAAEVQCTILVLSPATGDEVQAMKGGVIEAADVVALNKSDLPGAHAAANELRLAINGPAGPRRAVVETTATTGGGIADLWQEVERSAHRAPGPETGPNLERVVRLALAQMEADLRAQLTSATDSDFTSRVKDGQLDDWDAAAALVSSVLGGTAKG